MTPAFARAFLLYLLLAWFGVLALWLASSGVRRLTAAGSRAERVRGGLWTLGGLLALAWVGWAVT